MFLKWCRLQHLVGSARRVRHQGPPRTQLPRRKRVLQGDVPNPVRFRVRREMRIPMPIQVHQKMCQAVRLEVRLIVRRGVWLPVRVGVRPPRCG